MKVRIEGMEDYEPPGRRRPPVTDTVPKKTGERSKPEPPEKTSKPDKKIKTEELAKPEDKTKPEGTVDWEEDTPPKKKFGFRKQKAEPEVMAEWELDPDEVMKIKRKKKVKGKKQVIIGLAVIGILILAATGLYYFALPRLDVEIVTVYHEGTGGASSGGFINVNTKIANKGTREIEDVNITIDVVDTETGEVVASTSDFFYTIDNGNDKEPKLNFMGDHYQPYDIVLSIEFEAGGKSYNREYTYDTDKSDAMNIIFRDHVSGWLF